jgi:hypothetical protein
MKVEKMFFIGYRLQTNYKMLFKIAESINPSFIGIYPFLLSTPRSCLLPFPPWHSSRRSSYATNIFNHPPLCWLGTRPHLVLQIFALISVQELYVGLKHGRIEDLVNH